MSERFGERARHVVDAAGEQARKLRHDHIAPGHLLLGLLEDAEVNGGLEEMEGVLGVPAARVRAAVTGALGRGTAVPGSGTPLTAETSAVLDLAEREAQALGDAWVHRWHIVLGLISQDSATAAGALRESGVDLAHTLHLITGLTPPAAPAALLATVTRDLSASGTPVVGRASEIDRVLQVLTRHHRNTPLLVGEPGVGKEAVVRGVALAIAEGRVPAPLRGRTVRALDLGAVLTDPQHRARGTALLADLLSDVEADARLVLCLDGALTPLHLPEGGTTTPLALFRPLLEAPEVYVLGDCGRAEYDRRDPDPGLDRLLQPVPVEEPSAADVLRILGTVRDRLERHHTVTLTEEALTAAASLAREHVPDQALPGAAIGLLDEAAALARMRAARSDPPSDQPLEVTEPDVARALAAYSGIRPPESRPATAPRIIGPVGHDPSVWALS
ncbi:Clp protease N-terminal domain-containing protein [Streptomyces sp. NPDC006739]|uniref:Clp protease N-terminal domain-containing protein n=1 Tax=Streptomyces sp. NPDC006739 TaxID=3364763 RepID=UPI0036B11F50